jgi:hypothetical protein
VRTVPATRTSVARDAIADLRRRQKDINLVTVTSLVSASLSPLLSISTQCAVQRFISYHSNLILSRSRVSHFRTFKATRRLIFVHLRAVRGATVGEFTIEPSGCQIRPHPLFRAPSCTSISRMAVRGATREEFTTPSQKGQIQTIALFQSIQRLGLSGTRPSRAQRGGTILRVRPGVKFEPPTSHAVPPRLARGSLHRCTPGRRRQGGHAPDG